MYDGYLDDDLSVWREVNRYHRLVEQNAVLRLKVQAEIYYVVSILLS
ncbi:hypothetical protein AZE42_07189 [Rhizopogon vesiculosus]|uniref:Uncharacterized protein n=1 Tax=Rhizopogon vesiculosus TaxID=180088 RepID=A0A1J8PQ89_9AGAM|nr:hypothetical protein AZE42_07189 [Rhizopogon vesiculosus]